MNDYVYLFGPKYYSSKDALWISEMDYGIKVKVGFTKDPTANLRSLQRANPDFDYWSVKYTKGSGHQIEQALHMVWAPFRIHKNHEFFALPTLDVMWFEEQFPARNMRGCDVNYLYPTLAMSLVQFQNKHEPVSRWKFWFADNMDEADRNAFAIASRRLELDELSEAEFNNQFPSAKKLKVFTKGGQPEAYLFEENQP